MEDARYPFLAELLNWEDRSHRCLGTLVASDMVLTAAHCVYDANVLVQLPADTGGTNATTTTTIMLFVVQTVFAHPSYYYNAYTGGIDVDPYDVALLQLCGRATTTGAANATTIGVAALNRNSTTLPLTMMMQQDEQQSSTRHSDQLLVGLGWDENGDAASVETTYLTYVSNDDCVLVNGTTGDGLEVSYASQIVDVSLCAAYGQGPGLCPGDSGGPIFLADSSTSPPSARVELGLVGVTSSSYGCRDELLPTLNVRVSKVSDWVGSVVCNASRYPVPVDFGCQGNNRTDDDQDDVNRPMVELTVQLELGGYPENFGWILYQVIVENGTRRLFAIVEHPLMWYMSFPPNAIINETVRIQNGASYEILVLDINEESFRIATSLRLWSNGETVEARNVDDTLGKRTYQFTLGSHQTSAPDTLNPTVQPTLLEGSTYLTVFISLDDYPTETGFLVEDLPVGAVDESESLPLLYACYPGTFGADMARREVQVAVPLPISAKRVLFTMTDNEHDGLEPPAFYELWLGPRSTGTFLAQGGVFYLEDRHEISIPGSQDVRNTHMPSSSPFVADAAFTSLGCCPTCWIQMQFIAAVVVISLFHSTL